MDAKELIERYRAGERSFRRVNLSGANLIGALLSNAIFDFARLDDAKLHDAQLDGTRLRSADLSDADLSDATLGGADLTGALLLEADLSRANLSCAYLSGADLSGANLTGANLTGADLSFADLDAADLTRADLSHANFGCAYLGRTHLVDIDVFALAEADPAVWHYAPSTIDHRTVQRSLHAPSLRRFLMQCGVPEMFVEHSIHCAQVLNGAIIGKVMRSTFISYGGPDEAFARKLYEALARNGVTAFFFAEHAVPGEKLHDMMRNGVNRYDRVVLVCSKDSLSRNGVLAEIEQVLAREARAGGDACLIPIRLDNFVFDEWAPTKAGMKQEVCDRVVADFRGADADPAKFDAALLRLVTALKV